MCALCVYESVRRFPREALAQSYLFEPPAELRELESARVRAVSNTDGVRDALVLVRALRQQRSCCERCDSNIYAHKVAESGAETRPRQRMGNIDSEKTSHSGESCRKSRHTCTCSRTDSHPTFIEAPHTHRLFNLGPESIHFRHVMHINMPFKTVTCNTLTHQLHV